MKNLKTQGFILIDVDVVALNNAGKSETTQAENGVATKKIRKNGRSYTYVSGQAWRFWWRNTLQKQFGWELSPVIRAEKVAFTSANPMKHPDDDIFGYMKAAKDVRLDADGKPVLDSKGKEVKDDVTVTRVSPLKNSAIISVTATSTVENFSVMARQDGDPVPYTKEEYSAIMKGMFSLDLEQLGTFATYNKTGFKNLSQSLRDEAIKSGATQIPDPHLVDAKGEPHQLIRLDNEIRKTRAAETIQALKLISGGAMQTNNMADVTPKFIVLATTTSGNHPFSHIVTTRGERDEHFVLNHAGLAEVLTEYKDQILGKVFIGVRSGFLSEYDLGELKKAMEPFAHVEIKTVNEAIDQYAEQLKGQIQ
ncbi:MAG: type I-B CRISPR-associated protein Cas7/Cst2/DevR [Saprospiraceae bacterium]|nr:MAG: type I-B CRISPR-associated protein Cas7/Cst2/DevR [Saprospiraceae bacterium]